MPKAPYEQREILFDSNGNPILDESDGSRQVSDFCIEEQDDSRTWPFMNDNPLTMDCEKMEAVARQNQSKPQPKPQPKSRKRREPVHRAYPSGMKITERQFYLYYTVINEVINTCGKIAAEIKSNGKYKTRLSVGERKDNAYRKLTGIISSIAMQAGLPGIGREDAQKIIEMLSYDYRDIYDEDHPSEFERIFEDDKRRKAWRRQITKNIKGFVVMSIWDIERNSMR